MWLGQYEILKSLGKGTFGEVLLARTTTESGFQRQVAIKRLRDSVAEDPEMVERFAIEARICGFLSHPNVVHVYNFVKADEGYLLVMEFLEGATLREILHHFRRSKTLLPTAISLELVSQLCAALHCAHTAKSLDGVPLGLVHRDVKPGNLMVTTNGQLKLMDFGVARADFARTRTGVRSLKGTLQYMAPEQATGTAITPGVDQFAAGLILAELLLGRPVYKGNAESTLLFQAGSGAVGPALEKLRPLYPSVYPVLEQALAKDPAHRFPDQGAMGRALRALLSTLPEAQDIGGMVNALKNGEPVGEKLGLPLPPTLQEALEEEKDIDHLRDVARRLSSGTPSLGEASNLSLSEDTAPTHPSQEKATPPPAKTSEGHSDGSRSASGEIQQPEPRTGQRSGLGTGSSGVHPPRSESESASRESASRESESSESASGGGASTTPSVGEAALLPSPASSGRRNRRILAAVLGSSVAAAALALMTLSQRPEMLEPLPAALTLPPSPTARPLVQQVAEVFPPTPSPASGALAAPHPLTDSHAQTSIRAPLPSPPTTTAQGEKSPPALSLAETARPKEKAPEAPPANPDPIRVAAMGSLQFRVVPANSRVFFQSREVGPACWRGCPLPAGRQTLVVSHPDGHDATVELQIPENTLVKCSYSFGSTPPLSCQ